MFNYIKEIFKIIKNFFKINFCHSYILLVLVNLFIIILFFLILNKLIYLSFLVKGLGFFLKYLYRYEEDDNNKKNKNYWSWVFVEVYVCILIGVWEVLIYDNFGIHILPHMYVIDWLNCQIQLTENSKESYQLYQTYNDISYMIKGTVYVDCTDKFYYGYFRF
jgi:hypothetical protein